MSNITKLFNRKEIAVMVVFVVVVIFGPITAMLLQSNANNQTSRENQGYLRYLACVADVRNKANALTISVNKLDQCWELAEAQAGVDLPRYYNQVK